MFVHVTPLLRSAKLRPMEAAAISHATDCKGCVETGHKTSLGRAPSRSPSLLPHVAVHVLSDAFSSGGNELRMASSTGCADEKEPNWGVCASAGENVRKQKRNKQSVLPSLLGIGVSTGRAPGRKAAGFSLPLAHNTVASSQLPVADRSLPTIAGGCEFGSSCFLGSGLGFSKRAVDFSWPLTTGY